MIKLTNLRRLFLYKTLDNFFFAVPILVLFWQDNGLNLAQITLLQSLFAIAVVFLEIPTGYFADIFGRKNALVLGAISWTVGVFCIRNWR
jgi:MFS family permease